MPTVSFNTHLPDYEVLAELGRGNTRVLKARHVPTGELVAIKQYAFAADADTLRRFERESQLMTQIDHPNVVRLREVHLGAALPYVVMDFVEGGDLRGLLRQQGHLDVPTTIRLGLQLTGAFRAMHPLQVVHRDIKPENVLYRRLVSGELHFLLTDFGIAKLRADDSTRTRTGQSLMTYEYAAPEQFDNPRQVDEAADYYALGVVLYECLTGRVPFILHDENGLGGFMNQVLTASVPAPLLPSGQPLPPSLNTLIMSLLTRSPQHRLRHPDQLELLLEQGRVEHLRANQTVPIAASRTVAGPVNVPVAAAVANEPAPQPEAEGVDEYEYEEPSGLSAGTWWGISGIVVALGLAAALYLYSPAKTPASVAAPVDSSLLAQPDTTFADTVPTTVAPPISTTTDEQTEDAEETDDNPTYVTDTTLTRTPADTAGTAPPDSTDTQE